MIEPPTLQVLDLRKAADLSAVQIEPDGVLKASAVAAVMCGDGEVGLLGLDQRGEEFVRMPLAVDGVRWLIGELRRLIGEGEAL